MTAPLRSYSYGPDFSNSEDMFATKKRKRLSDGDDSFSTHLLSLSGSQNNSQFSTTLPQIESDTNSSPGDSPGDVRTDHPFIFSSPTPTIFHTPRKLARPSKRTHFTRPSLNTLASSPVIPPTPALTFSSDNLSQMSQMNAATQACHLCQRRPANVQDLSAYIDCETCRQRTCNICTRHCEGPRCRTFISARQTLFSGATPRTAPDGEAPRGKAVCRTCCFEVGAEGHIWCTSCYADDTELENFGTGKTKESLEQESLGRIASWLQDCGPDDMITEEPEMDMENGYSWN